MNRIQLTPHQGQKLFNEIEEGSSPNDLIRPYNKLLVHLLTKDSPYLTQQEALEIIDYNYLAELIDSEKIEVNAEMDMVYPAILKK